MGGKMSLLVPGLYVGGVRNSQDDEAFQENKITHVLSIFHMVSNKSKNPDIKYHNIIANDNPEQNIKQYFPEAIQFIHDCRVSGGSCLVHCMMGVSRSVTLCVAYLTAITGLPYQQVLDSVRGLRHVANPNLGFQHQLAEWEREGRFAQEYKRLQSLYGAWPHREADIAMLDIGLKDFNTPRVRRVEASEVNSSKSNSADAEEKVEPNKGSEYFMIPHANYVNVSDVSELKSQPDNTVDVETDDRPSKL